MESKLAIDAERALVEATPKLSPEASERFSRALPTGDSVVWSGQKDTLPRHAAAEAMRTSGSGQSALLLIDIVDSLVTRNVDLLLCLRGMEPQAMSRVIEVPFQWSKLKFIGREDFIAMKVFAGGPVDLVDAARAISAGRDSLDLDLMRRLAKGYGRDTSDSLERLLARWGGVAHWRLMYGR